MLKGFDVVYQDNDIMVIEKPAGIVVESDKKNDVSTLENILKKEYKIDLPRGGIVHRLDRDTSGLMVIAKNEKSLVDLQNQFASHGVKKIYKALVFGDLEPKKGTINIALKRDSKNRTRFVVSKAKDAKEAITHYEKVESLTLKVKTEGATLSPILSLLRVQIETGRTHQIRAHMFAIGFPIVGDQVYKNRDSDIFSKSIGLERQFLHAEELSFKHPTIKKTVDFKSELPDNLNKIIK